MSRKKYYLILDVEGTKLRHVYDIGFTVIDKKANIYEMYSFVVTDIFSDKNDMATAYYFDKIPLYLTSIHNGTHTPATFSAIHEKIMDVMKRYNISIVCAYNIAYDIGALNTTMKYLSNGLVTKFFPDNVELWCIYTMSCQVLCSQKSYIKQAIHNNWITEKGNMRTGAEFVYRYISGDNSFEEKHTGLEDVLIEISIFDRCIRQHKHMEKHSIANPWRLVQPQYQEVLNTL